MFDPFDDFLRRTLNALRGLTPPAPGILSTAVATLGGWVLLTLLAPQLSPGTQFTLSFACGLAAFFARRFLRLKDARPDLLDDAISQMLAILTFGGIVGLVIWIDEPVICQRAVTGLLMFSALIHIGALLRGRSGLEMHWGDSEPDMQPALSGAVAILSCALAILNETLSQQIALLDWLVFWAILPVVMHYTYILTIHIVLLTDDAEI